MDCCPLLLSGDGAVPTPPAWQQQQQQQQQQRLHPLSISNNKYSEAKAAAAAGAGSGAGAYNPYPQRHTSRPQHAHSSTFRKIPPQQQQHAHSSAFRRLSHAPPPPSHLSASAPASSSPPLHKRPRSSLLYRMTSQLVGTYQDQQQQQQQQQQQARPRAAAAVQAPPRVLTKPSLGTKNDGHDNDNSDLILLVNDVLVNHQPLSGINRVYVIQDMLGQGTFGQVVACRCDDWGKEVAVKVIKNQQAYYHQARVEIGEWAPT